jgi:hypothetical protein
VRSGKRKHPERIGIALDTFTGIKDRAITVSEISGKAEGDIGVFTRVGGQ